MTSYDDAGFMDQITLQKAERKRRLTAILQYWKGTQMELEGQALLYFREQDLDRISNLIFQKRDLERRINRLDSFLRRFYP